MMSKLIALMMGTCLMMVGSLADAKDKNKAGGPKKKPSPQEVFNRLDTDGNGQLSLDEVKGDKHAKSPEQAETRFSKMDADGDGNVTLEEFKAFIEHKRDQANNKKHDKKPNKKNKN